MLTKLPCDAQTKAKKEKYGTKKLKQTLHFFK